jgi:hypothetical protein
MDDRLAHVRARVAALERGVRRGVRPADDPELVAARRELRGLSAEAYVRRLVAEAPPLSDAQKLRLTALLTAPHVDGGGGRAA